MSELPNATATPGPLGRSLLRSILDLFSSVWLGIVLFVLIFIYSSIGSALPPVRQHWLLEMTEFEFFNWWPFDLLIFLLATTITVVTVRKIRFNRINLGVWMIHLGIVVLALGSAYYFGTKVEGDTPIYRRRLVIRVPGEAEPLHLVTRPGNRAAAGSGADRYEFEIVSIQPEYVLRSEGHQGERAYAVQVAVRSPEKNYIRQVLAGYPEFTEDVIPGQGRAIKAIGQALVDEVLEISLELEPQEYFYLQDSTALYVRPLGSDSWVSRPIDGMPHYHERFASREEVWLPRGEPFPRRPIDLEVPASAEGDPLADYEVRVTGYLRYAFEESRWVPGGDRLNPVCGLRLISNGLTGDEATLRAFDDRANHTEGGAVVFRWVDSADELEALGVVSRSVLSISVPQKGVAFEVPPEELSRAGDATEFHEIPGTQYAFRLRSVINHMNVPSGRLKGRTISVAVVEVKKGDESYTRWVCDVAEATRDLGTESHEAAETDPDIVMTYQPGDAWQVIVAAGPEAVGTHVLTNNGQQEVQRQAISPGQRVSIADGLEVELSYLYSMAKQETRPAIVPRSRRDRDARKSFSMIKIEVSRDAWSTSRWLPYNHYALPSRAYSIPGRMAYLPESLRLPDGQRVQVMYSRQRMELPSPVALDTFELVTFAGGLIGRNSNVRDYVSMLRFQDQSGQWSEPVQMSSNRPAHNGGFWFFQSTWDPPSRGSAGMNYTGAGVGNRNGVYIQLAGCCIAVSGMIYAFYFKPILKRRKHQEAARRGRQGTIPAPPAQRPLETAAVS